MRIVRIVLLVSLVAAWQVTTSAHDVGAAGSLQITPNTLVTPGGNIYIAGTGANPGSSITVTLSTPTQVQTQTPVTVDNQGNWSVTLTVPATTPATTGSGSYSVTATSNNTTVATGSITVASELLTVKPSTVQPGTTVSVSGQGFTAYLNQQVQIQVAGQYQLATISSTGALPATQINIPSSVTLGNYALTVVPYLNTSLTLVSTLVTVSSSQAYIYLGSSSSATVQAGPNATVTVNGFQFPAGDNVSVSYSPLTLSGTTETISGTAPVTSSGQFTVSLNVPANVAAGVYSVVASDQSANVTASAQLTVQAATPPTITVSPQVVTGGNTVSVAGSNFTPGSDITVSASVKTTNGQTVPLTTTVLGSSISSSGTFSAQLPIPAEAVSGPVKITASQTVGGAQVSATTTLIVTAARITLTVNPGSSQPGGTVTVAGQGFAPSSNVTISSSPSYLTGSTTTDGFGNFSVQLTVSSSATTASVSVTARDSTGISSTAVLVVNAPLPTATPSPTPTPTLVTDLMPSFAHAAITHKTIKEGQYDTVTLQGSPATTLKVRLQVLFPGGQHLKLTTSTDDTGAWSHMFHVPKNAIGKYSHTAFLLLQLWNGTHSRKDFLPLTIKK